jgi:hypothetical protein
VFASPVHQGRWPYLAQEIIRHHIRPIARKLAITKRIGWHTFRHTYSTLLRSTGAELKIMQELLRHSTIRVTLDTYTQAVTAEKRAAQEAVVALLFPEKTLEALLGQTPTRLPILCLFVPARKSSATGKCLKEMAGTTRLELATSAVTVHYFLVTA